MPMAHEIKIDGTTFTVNCYARSDARETLEQLLKRVIIKNAEKELKKRVSTDGSEYKNIEENGDNYLDM
ncbi:hypothetical protein FACS189490_03270 [Clostridia bacterium]|nr:hypothetical protein FACS189490_03270 [Clostridia bacterium]